MLGYLAVFTVTSYFLVCHRVSASGKLTAFTLYEKSFKENKKALFFPHEQNTIYTKEWKQIYNVKEFPILGTFVKHSLYAINEFKLLKGTPKRSKDNLTIAMNNKSRKRSTEENNRNHKMLGELSKHVVESRFVNLPLDALQLLVQQTQCPLFNIELVGAQSVWQPAWLSQQPLDLIGFCPSRLRAVQDPTLLWPHTLVAVECLCRETRCSMQGPHRCITVYALVPVIRIDGHCSKLVAVGCVCAAQIAIPTKQNRPPTLAFRK